MLSYTTLFFIALVETVSIEVVVAWMLATAIKGMPRLRVLLPIVALASCVTLPFVWYVFPALIADRTFFIIVSESFAVIAEAVTYVLLLRLKPAKAFWLSLITNAVSFVVGLLLHRVV